MRTIALQPLTPDAFAPFGEVIDPPAAAGKAFFENALRNHREAAWPSLYLSRLDSAAETPLRVVQMERHRFSSQTFVPNTACRFVVIVAPHRPDGGPDTDQVRAFLAAEGQGVTYAADIWHHPLTVLDAPATFSVFMFRDNTTGDEEFVDVEPFAVSM